MSLAETIIDRLTKARERALVASLGQGKAWRGVVARMTREAGLLAMALDFAMVGDAEGAKAWMDYLGE